MDAETLCLELIATGKQFYSFAMYTATKHRFKKMQLYIQLIRILQDKIKLKFDIFDIPQLYHLHNSGIIDDHTLIQSIDNHGEEPLKILPELEHFDKTRFDDFFRLNPNYNVDKLKQNNWNDIRKSRLSLFFAPSGYISEMDNALQIILADDLEGLKEMMCDPHFDYWEDHGLVYLIDFAALHQSIKCFRHLFINIPGQHHQQRYGLSLFGAAIEGGSSEIIQILYEKIGSGVWVTDCYEEDDYWNAGIRSCRLDILTWCLDEFPRKVQDTCFNEVPFLKGLILFQERGLIRSSDWTSILSQCQLMWHGIPAIIDWLIRQGADAKTALEWAIVADSKECVSFLLESVPMPNDILGKCVSSEMADFLVQNGAQYPIELSNTFSLGRVANLEDILDHYVEHGYLANFDPTDSNKFFAQVPFSIQSLKYFFGRGGILHQAEIDSLSKINYAPFLDFIHKYGY